MTYNAPKGSRQLVDENSYFMGKLLMDSVACRDPEVQKAALIADAKGHVLSFGVNYIVREYVGTQCSWQERDFALYSAEEMALDEALRSNVDLSSCTMYLTNPPTSVSLIRCLRHNLKKIIYLNINEAAVDYQDWEKAKLFAKEKKVDVKLFDGNLNWIRDRIKKLSHLF